MLIPINPGMGVSIVQLKEITNNQDIALKISLKK